MKKKTIYIHIGTPKTGTTSIQKFLTKNIDILSEEGIFYPLAGRHYPKFNNINPKDYKNLNCCMNGGVLNKKHELRDVLKNFAKSKKNTMLLSEECLFLQYENNSFCNKETIWNLLSNYEIKIIVYFRRSVDYLCSLWQEYMKYRVQTDLLDFLENEDYLKNLRNLHGLSKQVGKENIIVRTFEKEIWPNNSLIEDFLSILKIKKSTKFQEFESFENSGFSRSKCDMLLYVNKHLRMETSDQDHYGVNIRIPTGDNDQKVIDSLSDELIEKLTDKYYEEECKIAKTFLNREELFRSKYPKIYKKKRVEYKTQISNEDKEELRFIVNSTLQKQIIDKQNKMIELQRQSLKKGFVFLSKVNKFTVLFICSLVPSKEYRAKIRRYFLAPSNLDKINY